MDTNTNTNTNTSIEFLKSENIESPLRAHTTDAGIDFRVPKDHPTIILRHGETIKIDLPIYVKVPKDCMFMIANKSGVSLKKGLIVGGGIIDENYQGTIGIQITKIVKFKTTFTQKLKNLVNYGVFGDVTVIKPNDKIVQGIIIPVKYNTPKTYTINGETYQTKEDFFDGIISDRGESGYGSTDYLK